MNPPIQRKPSGSFATGPYRKEPQAGHATARFLRLADRHRASGARLGGKAADHRGVRSLHRCSVKGREGCGQLHVSPELVVGRQRRREQWPSSHGPVDRTQKAAPEKRQGGLDAQEPPRSLFAELTHTINPRQRGASGGSSTAGLFQKDFRRRLVRIAIDALFQLPSCASGWGVVSSDEQSLDMDQQEMQNGRQ